MKLIGYIVSIIIIVVIIIPFLIIRGCDMALDEEKMLDLPPGDDIQISVLNHKDNKEMKISLEEYIVGVVAAEMPAIFELEALKAQAIAARTYTVRRMQQFGAKASEEHPKNDVCTDYRHCQAWINKEDRFQAWEKDKNLGLIDHVKLWNKLVQAISSTKGQIITYDGEPIDPLFHSTSGGKTENSEDYFVAKVPYLRSVDSQYEEGSSFMKSNEKLSIDEFIKILEKKQADLKVDKKNINKEINILNKTEGGKVGEIQIGNKTFSGREIREAFQLRSSGFTIEIKDEEVHFSVVGYGHGVGMSQFGADGMAKEGKTHIDILKHYYKGVEIVKIEP